MVLSDRNIVKVSWSSGKDSTCALDLHLTQGDYVKAVCYIPMFDDDIPLILKENFDFIMHCKNLFQKRGAEVFIVHGRQTYEEMFYRRKVRGPNKGKVTGFPVAVSGKCKFSQAKIKALNSVDVGYFDYEDIGVAVGEEHRMKDGKRSILLEKGFTEFDAFCYCRERGLLSPSYENSFRDGCVLCYNGKASERVKWFDQYPRAKEKVIEMQNVILKEGGFSPLRGCEWFIDPFQLSIFE